MGVLFVIASLLVMVPVSACAPRGSTEEFLCAYKPGNSHTSGWAMEARKAMEKRFQDEFKEVFTTTGVNAVEDPFYPAYKQNMARFERGNYL